ncbi:MAG: hypothetical protein F6K19_14780 [Cyanothece sp. SIO1E1]|nr:hypothetical protein [Cyanothece sp. SIO1E1]
MSGQIDNLEVKGSLTDDPALYDYPRRDLADIQAYLERISEIIELGSFDIAVCSAVFVAEALMRLIAERYSIEFESKHPIQLAQTFYKQSLMSQSACQTLTQAIDIRDKVMQKAENVTLDASFTDQLVKVIQHLFSQISQSVVVK